MGLAVLASLVVVWLLGFSFGDVTECVAEDPTLLRVHRILDVILAIVTVVCWIGGTAYIARTKSWRRVGQAFVVPGVIIGILIVTSVLKSQAPGWLDVSGDTSPACF